MKSLWSMNEKRKEPRVGGVGVAISKWLELACGGVFFPVGQHLIPR